MSKLTVIACKCGAHYAAAVVPVSETFQKEILAAAKKGHTVCELPLDGFAFGKCKCKKAQKVTAISKPIAQPAPASRTVTAMVIAALNNDEFNF
jgi:hypothetical protein